MVSGGGRVPGPAPYDYVTLEEGLKQAGLVTVGLLRACLSSNVPIVLGGHSFGVGVARVVASGLERALRSGCCWRMTWDIGAGVQWTSSSRLQLGAAIG